MINQKKAFTLAELVIVITIIVTLTSVSFVSYMSNLVDSRNATRVSELGNIKISLKNHKINNAMYPNPGASFNITQ
jgi:prepilin-type N-terminal cleavage/methylation domain-containing protein